MKLPKALVFVGELAIDLFHEWRASRAQRNAALAAKRAEQSRRYQQASRAAGRPCTLPPEGWRCSRPSGHEGPCAAERVLH